MDKLANIFDISPISDTHLKMMKVEIKETLIKNGKDSFNGWWKGKSRPEETKKKISEKLKGRPVYFSETHKHNLSLAKTGHAAGMTGLKHNNETKKKMSLATKKRKRTPLSEAHRQKVSEAIKKVWEKRKNG